MINYNTWSVFDDRTGEIKKYDLLVKQVIGNDSENIKSVNKTQYIRNTSFRLFPVEREQDITLESYIPNFPRSDLSLAHVAAFYDALECLIVVLDSGIEVDAVTSDGYTPLMYACANSSLECATYLLSKKADPNKETQKYNRSPLYFAAYSGSSTLLGLLFDYNAKMPNTLKRDNNPLMAAIQSKHIDCLEILLKRGFKPTFKDGEFSPLMNAINMHLDDAIELLLQKGADVKFTNSKGNTALVLAIRRNSLPLVKLLLSYGAKVDTYEVSTMQTPLHLACSKGNLEMVKLLVKAGADLKAQDAKQRIATFYAINADVKDIIPLMSYLYENGLDFNHTDKDNSTVLHDLLSDSQKATPEVLSFLLSHGARIDIESSHGHRTAYELAVAFFPKKDSEERKLFEQYNVAKTPTKKNKK